MKSLFLSLVLCGAAFGQATAVFPGAIASYNQLQLAANNAQTQLTTTLSASQMTIPVLTTSGFPLPTTVTVDNEIISICSAGANVLNVCTVGPGRGAENTQAVSHMANAYVQLRMTAQFHNQGAAEIIALETRAKNDTWLGDYNNGVNPCDGVTDTAPMQRAGIAYLQGVGGGNLHYPQGKCMAYSSVDVPQGVRLIGAGMQVTILQAGVSPTCPASPVCWNVYADVNNATFTYMLSLGGNQKSTNAIPYNSIESMEIYAANNTATNIFSGTAEEGSRLKDLLLTGCSHTCIDIEFYGVQNFRAEDLAMYPSGNSPASSCIIAQENNARMEFKQSTCNGFANLPANTGTGIQLNTFGGQIDGLHCEEIGVCVDMALGSQVNLQNIECGPFVGVCTKAEASSAAMILTNISINSNGAGPLGVFQDGINGFPIFYGYGVAFYATNASGGNIITTEPSYINRLRQAQIGSFNFLVDSGGGMDLRNITNNEGVMIQSVGASGAFTGGGLFLNGTGYANDPSSGVTGAGLRGDLGTFFATAPAASATTYGQGTACLAADNGLVAGAIYPTAGHFPTQRICATPTGVILAGPPALKVLRTNQIGNLDNVGNLGMAGGTVVTYNFQNVFSQAPTCVASNKSSFNQLMVTTTNAQLTITEAATSTDNVSYMCWPSM